MSEPSSTIKQTNIDTCSDHLIISSRVLFILIHTSFVRLFLACKEKAFEAKSYVRWGKHKYIVQGFLKATRTQRRFLRLTINKLLYSHHMPR